MHRKSRVSLAWPASRPAARLTARARRRSRPGPGRALPGPARRKGGHVQGLPADQGGQVGLGRGGGRAGLPAQGAAGLGSVHLPPGALFCSGSVAVPLSAPAYAPSIAPAPLTAGGLQRVAGGVRAGGDRRCERWPAACARCACRAGAGAGSCRRGIAATGSRDRPCCSRRWAAVTLSCWLCCFKVLWQLALLRAQAICRLRSASAARAVQRPLRHGVCSGCLLPPRGTRSAVQARCEFGQDSQGTFACVLLVWKAS